MKTSADTPLLNLMWRLGCLTGRSFTGVCGESVEVVSAGDYCEERGIWYGAEVVVDGQRRLGCVAVGRDTRVVEIAVLRVVEEDTRPVLGYGDDFVTQITYEPPAEIAARYARLRDGAPERLCVRKIAEMDSLRRTDLLTRLMVERLQRKSREVKELYEKEGKDWNQAFYVMLMRAMGGDRNRAAFAELASRATYVMVSKEKGSNQSVEALLTGTSGFLFANPEKDDYTARLENEFAHLANKYEIKPLKPAVWDLRRMYPRNHPVVRIAQMAALLSKKEFMLDSLLACRTAADVEALFSARASEYWDTHYTPGIATPPSPKRIGVSKTHIIGINLVVPLMFAYGKENSEEALCERALDLLETIPSETNKKLRVWTEGGCVPENGFESQALLQLDTVYCTAAACAGCPVGKSEIKKAVAELLT